MSESVLFFQDSIPSWLYSHPQFQPWQEGVRRLVQKMDSAAAYYSPLYYDDDKDNNGSTENLECKRLLIKRLYLCLLYHWEKTDISLKLEEIQDYLQNRMNFAPLEEIVFTEAIYERQNLAARCFEKLITPYLRQTGQRLLRILHFPDDKTDECQNDFFIFLLKPSDEKPCIILRYQGMVPLKNWLSLVFSHYVNNQWRKRKRISTTSLDVHSPQVSVNETSEEQLSQISSFGVFLANSIKEIIARLDAESRMRLEYSYIENLTNVQIASILQEHPSNTTRKRLKAEEFIAKELHNKLSESTKWNEYVSLFPKKRISDLLETLWGERK